VIDDRPQANPVRFYYFDGKQQDGEGDEDSSQVSTQSRPDIM
jgi:hypothetical protein